LDKQQPAIDLANRLTLRPAEAARVLGVSDRMLRALLPALPHLRAGTAVLISVDGLRQWVSERARVTSPLDSSPGPRPRFTDGAEVAAEILRGLERK